MKKTVLGAMFALFLGSFAFAQDDVIITEQQLPTSVKRGVKKYFSGKAISSIVKDREDGKVVYDVRFQDYTEAEFASNGVLFEAKNNAGISHSVVPSKVSKYVRTNYPQAKITHWDKEYNRQKVEFSNDVELEFDGRGNFLRIDD